MATYPSSILVKGDVINEVDVVDQNDHNILKGEIIALQTYIGTNPQGSKNNLTDRLAIALATNGAWAQSNAFPATPSEGQQFWRPDLITAYIYSSSQAAWQSLGQSLSNTLFAFCIPQVGPTSFGTCPGDSVTRTYYLTKFKKLQGVSSTDIYAYVTNAGGTSQSIKLSFIPSSGTTAYGSISGNLASAGVGGTSFNISLTGLTNGTVYDVIIEHSQDGSGGRINSIMAIGK